MITETDFLGTVLICKSSVYGIQTARSISNFSLSGVKLSVFPEGYRPVALSYLSDICGLPVDGAVNLVEASSDLGAFVTFSSTLKRTSIKLSKICDDLQLLSSGPIAGICEIRLLAAQAESSIMSGKINPDIPEAVNQVCYQIMGSDLTIQ